MRGDRRARDARWLVGLVYGAQARPAVARNPRSVSHLGIGDHAAADARGGGAGALSAVSGSLSHSEDARGRERGGGAGAVERAGVLPTGTYAASRGEAGSRRVRGRAAAKR